MIVKNCFDFVLILVWVTFPVIAVVHGANGTLQQNDTQTDLLVEEILTWIQNTYSDKNRPEFEYKKCICNKVRQGFVDGRKPRPFESGVENDRNVNDTSTGYPVRGYLPSIPFMMESLSDYEPDIMDEESSNKDAGVTTLSSIKSTLMTSTLTEKEDRSLNNSDDISQTTVSSEGDADGDSDGNGDGEVGSNMSDSEDNHPPHIHKIDGLCSKNMMTVNLEFNKEFNGIVYSKDYYDREECRFVRENSNRKKFEFKVEVNKCGTTFNADESGTESSYLENTLVFQTEPNVQEEWDYTRSVRCIRRTSYKHELNSQLNLAMLKNDVLNFNGSDDATVTLEIKQGNDPLAVDTGPIDNSLIRIGENMTLALTLMSGEDSNIVVKKCKATSGTTNSTSTPSYTLDITDENGCILKPKFFGSFQTLKMEPKKTDLNADKPFLVVKYAYFKAFKFPDSNDVQFECNVEICKDSRCQTDETCENSNRIYPKNRRKRRYAVNNKRDGFISKTNVKKSIRVIVPGSHRGTDINIKRKPKNGTSNNNSSDIFSST